MDDVDGPENPCSKSSPWSYREKGGVEGEGVDREGHLDHDPSGPDEDMSETRPRREVTGVLCGPDERLRCQARSEAPRTSGPTTTGCRRQDSPRV